MSEEIETKIVERDGQKWLTLDFRNKGVEFQVPADLDTIEAACSALMMNLAGVSEAELVFAAFEAAEFGRVTGR